MKITACSIAIFAAVSASAHADMVQVTAYGTVEYNFISPAPLGGFLEGAPATMSFLVDSNNFVDSQNFPTRGYPIDQSSFVFNSGSSSIGLQNPFPAGQTPYFAIRNNDPAVDGFILSDSYEFPGGVELNQASPTGIQYFDNYYVTYDGSKLNSLDILGALGTYDFTGLQVFNWTVDRNGLDFMGLVFDHMTIAAVPEPTTLLPLALILLACRRNRRSIRA